MAEQRIHRAVSTDGTELAGTVYGQGPPLVLVHGSLLDGESHWGELVPLLADRFTCYLMNLRGRGSSGDGADYSPDRLVDDVTAFAESIGTPVGMVGASGGGRLALGAAARSDAVTKLAAYEPGVLESFDDEANARFAEMVGHMGDALAEGRPADAAQLLLEVVCNQEELSLLSDADFLEGLARYVPVELREFEAEANADGTSPTAPEVLERITVPLLLLRGDATEFRPLWDGVDYVAQRVPKAEVRDLPGVGHAAPITHPDPVARELVRFFAPA